MAWHCAECQTLLCKSQVLCFPSSTILSMAPSWDAWFSSSDSLYKPSGMFNVRDMTPSPECPEGTFIFLLLSNKKTN